ncbi:MAG: prepilin-type N-terminal cleavage/methylation domain-containing protein [Candidatus Omnitrophica bacterium]|nr:prepilin-type N-terminal cleavage/methylation domain-containing protein [Candidatus Omnitrophota bacterium]
MMWPTGRINDSRPHPPAGGDVSRGFSLVELLVVVLLIAVLAAAAAPVMAAQARGMLFSSELHRFETVLRYVQRKAIMEEQSYQVIVDPAGRSYAISRAPEPAAGAREERLSDNVLNSRRLPESFSIGNEQEQTQRELPIIFSPTGLATPARIIFADGYGRRAVCTISLSGEVAVVQL